MRLIINSNKKRHFKGLVLYDFQNDISVEIRSNHLFFKKVVWRKITF